MKAKKQSAASTLHAIHLAGGASKLARKLKLRSSAVVHQWTVTQVPAQWCPHLEEITGVRCEDLRPDIKWSVLRKKYVQESPVIVADKEDSAQVDQA